MGSMAFDLYNFKWEASPGLEHHCGICSKGLSNPRSVSSCIGVHCEPCRRYHQQLHFIQKAHECKSCIRADQMHHRRHRSIAILVKELEAHDRQVATRATRTKSKQRSMSKNGNDNVENLEPTRSVNDGGLDDDDAYYNQIFCERETEPFITMPTTPFHIPVPLTPKPSSSISSFGYESSPAISAKKKDLKKARRTARLASNNSQNIVSSGFLDFIAEALHGSKITDISSAVFEEEGKEIGGNQFKNEDLMRENLGFQTFTRNSMQVRHIKDRWRKIGPHGKAQELAASIPTAPGFPKPKFVDINETTRFDVNFFARLGVKYENKGDSSKIRSEIVLKLVTEIQEDITIIGREEYETQVREAGFWRFVNRAAAQNLQEAHQDFSWATGEFRKRRRPGVLSEAETEPEIGARDEQGQAIQGNENDFSDNSSVPGTPSLVGSAFETQAEEEKETPQMKTPIILKFTNFDNGRKEVLWTATPSKVLSSPRILPSVEPETFPSPAVSSSPEALSPPAVLPSPRASFSPRVSSAPDAFLSPKLPSTPKALFSPKTLPPPTVWSSIKKSKLKPSKPIVNQNGSGPMNLFRLVKLEKKHVAVQLKHESSYDLYGDQLREQTGTTALASEFASFEADEENSQDDDDIWEVVRPSLPNVRAKNPYDLLSTVEEGSGNEDSSSEDGSEPN
ncbi:hypothetical protein VE03_05404 [Pseudogymnoascus sp. 23342-1-I1]|nr:hypothetical protein VE03_05404 [Pseudogymnoascus sp. 23342-1-I1]